MASAKVVFAQHGPGAVGLREVAEQAAVSHGLITHYFGTYEGLVEATLEATALEAQRKILDALMSHEIHDADELLSIFFDVLEQPHQGRLIAWAMMSGRISQESFFARRVKGPKLVADAVELRLKTMFPGRPVERDEIERLIILVMTVGFGHTMARDVLWDAIGVDNTRDQQLSFRGWLAEIVRMRLMDMLGVDTLP